MSAHVCVPAPLARLLLAHLLARCLGFLLCSHAAHAVDCQVVELLTYSLNNSKVHCSSSTAAVQFYPAAVPPMPPTTVLKPAST